LAHTACAPESPWLYAEIKRADRFAYLQKTFKMRCDAKQKKKSPSDLKQWNIVQAGFDKLFQLIHGCCALHGPESKFCCAPELLDEIELTVVFWVEVAEVAPGLNKFFRLRLVTGKVAL
jgi:hypothetical protein